MRRFRPSEPAPPAAAPTQAAPAQAGPLAADGPADVDPVAFFRAQQQPCGAHAEKFGNSPVEPERFTGAKLERALGDGEFLVTDGLGTRVVVRPADGIVLPESGSDTDVMPVPYNFGCPSDVFVGASED